MTRWLEPRRRFDAEAAGRAYVEESRREPTRDETLRAEYRAFLAGEPLQMVVGVRAVKEYNDSDGVLRSTVAEYSLECGHVQLGAFTPSRGPAINGRCAACWRARQAQRQADQVGMF